MRIRKMLKLDCVLYPLISWVSEVEAGIKIPQLKETTKISAAKGAWKWKHRGRTDPEICDPVRPLKNVERSLSVFLYI